MLDELLGQGFDVGLRDGEGEQQFQQLVILQGAGPALEEALPQALAMTVVMGFGRGFAALLVHLCQPDGIDLYPGCQGFFLITPHPDLLFWGERR